MLIKNIEVRNFKSFKHLSIQPSNFNVLIGPNASGKSNFLQVFKFLRDIVNLGIENAISLQGGIEYLQNIRSHNTTSETNFSIEILYTNPILSEKYIKGKQYYLTPKEFYSDFTIKFLKETNDFIILNDYLKQTFLVEKNKENLDENDFAICTIELYAKSNDKSGFEFDKKFKLQHLSGDNFHLNMYDILPLPFFESEIDLHDSQKRKSIKKSLLLENQFFQPYPNNVFSAFKNLSIYDLDSLKDNVDSAVIGRSRLEDNGNNIAIVLKKIMSNKESKREFFNYVKWILPFVEDIEVERILDKHLQIKFKESYNTNQYIPANLVSSGTITLLAIIVSLFFDNDEIIIFEEPGGRIHPCLIARIIDLMKEVSNRTQIFLTTHNPEIVKYAGMKNIFCLRRDANGFSTIDHISSKKDIVQFLENEIGLDELFVQNLLSK